MSGIINLIHILLIVPFFFYIYYRGINKKDNPMEGWLCNLLIILALTSLVYHIYKLYNIYYTPEGEKDKWKDWIYLTHIFIILPLLIYIGYNCNETARKYFEILLVVSFAALGYHSYNLIKYGL